MGGRRGVGLMPYTSVVILGMGSYCTKFGALSVMTRIGPFLIDARAAKKTSLKTESPSFRDTLISESDS